VPLQTPWAIENTYKTFEALDNTFHHPLNLTGTVVKYYEHVYVNNSPSDGHDYTTYRDK